MQPLSSLTASGQGSLVMPTSVAISSSPPPPPPPPPPSSPRQPAARTARPASEAAASLRRGVFLMRCSLLAGTGAGRRWPRWHRCRRGVWGDRPARWPTSVAEWPGLPVVPDPDPEAEESSGLEDQEHDDQHAVEQLLHLEDVRDLGRRGGDERQVLGQFPGQP